MYIPSKVLEQRILHILADDIGHGDITTALIVPQRSMAEAEVITKEGGVVAGIEEAKILLESLGLKAQMMITDGEYVNPKQRLMRISGNARAILSAERTLLNLVSRMSGIATATWKLVRKVEKTKSKTKIACTRKTAPGMLYFDKKAVQIGGGDTHRLHLDDMILIKENHVVIAGSLKKAIERAIKKASFSKKIEVEVTEPEDAVVAAKAGADLVMLDNFSPEKIRKAVGMLKKAGFYGKVLLEASGGITSENISNFVNTGVDIVSLGEVTDSVRAMDMSLEITKATQKLVR
jgi:nicotinate-nucleotide pyrophosphorylase (carboxylating)